MYVVSFILENRVEELSNSSKALWQVLGSRSIIESNFQTGITYDSITSMTEAYSFIQERVMLIYGWPEDKPNEKYEYSLLNQTANGDYDFIHWNYIKGVNRVNGGKCLLPKLD